MIFRQIATSWSYIHLLCQKRWHKSFFWAKCLTTQSTVGTRILPMGQRYQRASFLEVIRESCLSSDLIGSPDTNLHTAAPWLCNNSVSKKKWAYLSYTIEVWFHLPAWHLWLPITLVVNRSKLLQDRPTVQ